MVLPTPPHRYADMGAVVFAGWLEADGQLGFSKSLNANRHLCSVWCISVPLVAPLVPLWSLFTETVAVGVPP